MKKFLLLIFSLFLISAQGQTLRGGVSEDYIPKGFFGSWGVISKLDSSNNPIMFNKESRDIWTLSGYDNVLILENLESGAKSEIVIKQKNKDKNSLKFERIKTVPNEQGKTVYREIVEFNLFDKHFSGTDNFTVEKYDIKNKLIEKNEAKYIVSGVRLSGKTPNLD